MRVTTKQLLGFGGLALVIGLTAIAYNLPTSAISVGADSDIYVEVYSNTFETVIERPLDGDIYTDAEVSFQEIHSNAANVKYYLTYIDKDGNKTVHELTGEEVIPAAGTTESATKRFTLNLDEYGGYGQYIFRSVVTASDGRTREDAVQFKYAAINAEQQDVSVSEAQDSVSFRVYYSSGVKSISYQIYDADGKEVSRSYSAVTDSPETGGYLDLTRALRELSLGSGRYTILIYGYATTDASGEPLDSDSVYFDYTAPDVPSIPDTGSIISALNISKADYLITGLIGFSLISIIALFVIRRSRRRD